MLFPDQIIAQLFRADTDIEKTFMTAMSRTSRIFIIIMAMSQQTVDK